MGQVPAVQVGRPSREIVSGIKLKRQDSHVKREGFFSPDSGERISLDSDWRKSALSAIAWGWRDLVGAVAQSRLHQVQTVLDAFGQRG